MAQIDKIDFFNTSKIFGYSTLTSEDFSVIACMVTFSQAFQID